MKKSVCNRIGKNMEWSDTSLRVNETHCHYE